MKHCKTCRFWTKRLNNPYGIDIDSNLCCCPSNYYRKEYIDLHKIEFVNCEGWGMTTGSDVSCCFHEDVK